MYLTGSSGDKAFGEETLSSGKNGKAIRDLEQGELVGDDLVPRASK